MASLHKIKIASGESGVKLVLAGKTYFQITKDGDTAPTDYYQGETPVSPSDKPFTSLHTQEIYLNADNVLTDNEGGVYLAEIKVPLREVTKLEGAANVNYLEWVGSHPGTPIIFKP